MTALVYPTAPPSATLDAVLQRLDGVRKAGDGWLARCPAHDDHRPSLSIAVGERGVLVKCFAGCSTDDICRALGLTPRDLFFDHPVAPASPTASASAPRLEATYVYRDETGAARYRILRYRQPDGRKAFRQQTPDGRGGWRNGLHGAEPLPYRLPELRAAIAAAQAGAAAPLIYVVEGEKCADVVAEHGGVATTISGGSGNAKAWATVARHLAGCDVFILPDADEPGRKYAETAAAALSGTARSVKVVPLPGLTDGDDVVDWLAGGGTLADIQALAATTPEWQPHHEPPTLPRTVTASELLQAEFPAPRWAVPQLIPEGLTLLVGRPKLGKSWLTLDLAVAVAAGGHALGRIATPPGDVLLLALEDTPRRLRDRLQLTLDGAPAPAGLEVATEWPDLDHGGDVALDAWLSAHPRARLVIVDTLKRIRPAVARDANVYAADYDVAARLKAIADRHSVAVVVVHHTRKMAADDPLDTVSGTNGLAAAADTVAVLRREASRADATLYLRGRDVDESELALTWDPTRCAWTLAGDAAQFRRSQERQSIINTLTAAGAPLSPREIADALGKSGGAVRVTLLRMVRDGEVHALGGGRYTVTPPQADAVTQGVTASGPASPVTAPLVTPVTAVTPAENPRSDAENAVTPPVTEGVTPSNTNPGAAVAGATGATTVTTVTGVTRECVTPPYGVLSFNDPAEPEPDDPWDSVPVADGPWAADGEAGWDKWTR